MKWKHLNPACGILSQEGKGQVLWVYRTALGLTFRPQLVGGSSLPIRWACEGGAGMGGSSHPQLTLLPLLYFLGALAFKCHAVRKFCFPSPWGPSLCGFPGSSSSHLPLTSFPCCLPYNVIAFSGSLQMNSF